jgi:Sulfotransferase family
MPDPIFILSPPRSYTSVACAMLGQHPDLCGLPEVNLWVTDRMDEWLRLCLHSGSFLSHGLLRAVAHLAFGEQTDDSIGRARWWIEFRRASTTADVFRELAGAAAPRALVDKSPATVLHPRFLRHAACAFPSARYLHLVRHPRSTCASIVGAPEILAAVSVFSKVADLGACSSIQDPEPLWLESHRNIAAFLETVPAARQRRLRGEDLLADPDRHLADLAAWLGVPASPESLDAMAHPERSPFAGFGPIGARFGNDPKFLQQPARRAGAGAPRSLDGPVGWRTDGSGLSDDTRRLAETFGYR